MKKHLHNILAVTSSDVVSRLLGFATNAYLARVLGTSSFGIMSIGLSVLSYLAMLSSPGVHIQGTRAIATGQENAPHYVSSVNSLRLMLALGLVFCTIMVVAVSIDSSIAQITTIIFSLSALPIALSMDWYFQGRENLVVYATSKVVIALVYLIMTFLLVHGEMDVVKTSVGFLVANVVATSWLFYLFMRDGSKLSLVWRPIEWRRLLRSSLPLGVSSFLAQTIMNLPVLIVGAIGSSHDAGLFNGAMKLIFAAMLVDRVFYSMFFPVISRLQSTSAVQFRRTAALALKIVLAVAVPIVVVGGFYAHEIISVVYGSAFIEAALPFRYLLLYFLASVVNTVIMCAMIADSREREYLRIMATTTAVLILLCIILSFTHGLGGAALALAVGESFMTVLLYYKERSMFDSLTTIIAPSCVAGGILLSVLLLMNSVPPVLAMSFGTMVFFIALWLLKGISKEEYVFVRERFV